MQSSSFLSYKLNSLRIHVTEEVKINEATYQGTILAVYYCLLMITVGGKANTVNCIIIIMTNDNKPH